MAQIGIQAKFKVPFNHNAQGYFQITVFGQDWDFAVVEEFPHGKYYCGERWSRVHEEKHSLVDDDLSWMPIAEMRSWSR